MSSATRRFKEISSASQQHVHAQAKRPFRLMADIKGLHLQLSLLGCATEVITAGQGSALWTNTETQVTDMDFKGKRYSDRLLF